MIVKILLIIGGLLAFVHASDNDTDVECPNFRKVKNYYHIMMVKNIAARFVTEISAEHRHYLVIESVMRVEKRTDKQLYKLRYHAKKTRCSNSRPFFMDCLRRVHVGIAEN